MEIAPTATRYADGEIIDYTSFHESGYSTGYVVRYAPDDQQTTALDLLVCIRSIRSAPNSAPFPLRESQLRKRERTDGPDDH